MQEIRIPSGAKKILKMLEDRGFKAYVVGGCVRDILRGEEPHDWDITTSATPDEMHEVFADIKTVDTGAKHGTITVIPEDGELYEVTTFRIDGEYKDGRHPETVEFVTSLEGDLARRDFTMNAIAMDQAGNIVDPFGGEEDIKGRTIRCVGDPDRRFAEDGLRILRALRFASVLGFKIEDNTAGSIRRNSRLLEKISAERVNVELTKLLCGEYVLDVLLGYREVITTVIPELAPAIGFKQNSIWHCYDVYDHIAHSVAAYEGSDECIKTALLLHDIGKPFCYTEDEEGHGHFYGHGKISVDMAEKILDRLKYSNARKGRILDLIRYHDMRIEPEVKACRKAMGRLGTELFFDLAEVRRADKLAQSDYAREKEFAQMDEILRIAREIAASDDCLDLKTLAVNGDDLMRELKIEPGKKVGEILSHLLDKVLSDELANEKDLLLEYARKEVCGEL